MQNNDIKAFRQRLVRAGFTSISIRRYYDDTYIVNCTSSEGDRIYRCMTLLEIRNTPYTVWFD